MENQDSSSESVNLTKKDLADIVSSAVTAAVKAANEPTSIEKRKIDKENRDFEQEQKDRAEIGMQAVAQKEQQRAIQRMCSHEHKNGDSHCVYIIEKNGPGYILCQKNQCKIRPEPRPEKNADDAIYDTALFNKVFQKLPGNEIFQ